MKIRYINIQNAQLSNKSPQKIEKLIKKVKEQFSGATTESNHLSEKLHESENVIIAFDSRKIIGWINFENKQGVQKINALNVLPEYSNKRIQEELLEQAISELQNERPIITIAVNLIPYFISIIEKYHWEKTSYTITPECIQGMYNFNEHQKERHPQKRKEAKKLS